MFGIKLVPTLQFIVGGKARNETSNSSVNSTDSEKTFVILTARFFKRTLLCLLALLVALFGFLEHRHYSYALRTIDSKDYIFTRCGNDSCIMGVIEIQDDMAEERPLTEKEEPKDVRDAALWFANEHNLIYRGMKVEIERETEVISPDGEKIEEPHIYEIVLEDLSSGEMYELDIVRWNLNDKSFIDKIAGALIPRYDYTMFPEEFERTISLDELKKYNSEAYNQLKKELALYSVTTDSVVKVELSDREKSRKPGTTYKDKDVSFEVKFVLPDGKIHEVVIDSIV